MSGGRARSAAASVEQAPYPIETVDPGVERERQRRGTAERRVRVGHTHPGIGEGLVRIQHLQALVDPEDERKARERVEGEGAEIASLVFVVRRGRRPPEEPPLLDNRQLPG